MLFCGTIFDKYRFFLAILFSILYSILGPLNNTIGDMWRLIWQKEIQIVIMLTNLRESEKV